MTAHPVKRRQTLFLGGFIPDPTGLGSTANSGLIPVTDKA